jgi:hypothetical protein
VYSGAVVLLRVKFPLEVIAGFAGVSAMSGVILGDSLVLGLVL